MSLPEMSLAGGVMIVVIILIRALAINRLPKATFIALWTIALARLLIPFSFPSVLSVYSLFDRAPSSDGAAQNTGIAPPDNLPSANTHQFIQPAVSPSGEAAADGSVFCVELVWIVGAVIALAGFGAAYFLCFRVLRRAKPLSDASVSRWLDSHRIRRSIIVKSSGRVSAPLTYGLFRPVIILPESMGTSDTGRLDFVLSHELVHIRRFDLLRKLAVILAVCVHWFNPLVWVMLVIFNRDIELACDETVVSQNGHSSRKAYAMALIEMEEQRSVAGALYSCFNKNAVEERIVAIMKITRPTFTRLTLSAAVVLAVCLGFATTAYASRDEQKGIVISAADMEDIVTSAAIVSDTDGGETELPGITADKATEAAAEAPEVNAEPSGTPETAAQPAVSTDWVWPVNSDRITRNFGPSPNPDRGSCDHITIACDRGEDVVTAISGTVTEAALVPERGNYIVVCGEDNIRTLYAHLEEIAVSVGQTVSAGDRIGAAGATGMVTGVCLSFYVYAGDQPVDPAGFYE